MMEYFSGNTQETAGLVLVVGISLFLLFVGHAPVLPVVAGGVLAVLIVCLRAASPASPNRGSGRLLHASNFLRDYRPITRTL